MQRVERERKKSPRMQVSHKEGTHRFKPNALLAGAHVARYQVSVVCIASRLTSGIRALSRFGITRRADSGHQAGYEVPMQIRCTGGVLTRKVPTINFVLKVKQMQRIAQDASRHKGGRKKREEELVSVSYPVFPFSPLSLPFRLGFACPIRSLRSIPPPLSILPADPQPTILSDAVALPVPAGGVFPSERTSPPLFANLTCTHGTHRTFTNTSPP